MFPPPYWFEAVAHLRAADPVMAEIIDRYRGETLRPRGDAFHTLARAIAGQQISVKAAESVWRRIEAAAGNVAPEALLALTEENLRGCGLSQQKVRYLQGLAEFFQEERIADGHWDAMGDAEVIAQVTRIKGVGVWTAEMFLIFHLMRPDVLPLADLGLQKSIRLHYGGGKKKEYDAAGYLKTAAPWRPFRSVATWYLWRALDPMPVEY